MSEPVLLSSPNDQQGAFASHGLSSDPFAELPIPTVAADDSYESGFFMGAERRAVLDEVIHLCQFGNNLVAVLGESGIGKTALVHQAVLELRDLATCCLVDASSMTSMEDIFSQVVYNLGISLSADATAGEMLAAIRQHVPVGQHQRIVMLIDDAHYLDDQILAAIVSLLQGQQSYHLHVLLAGDDSLAARLDNFEMVDVLIYDIALRLFAADEVNQYLQFKLDLAGYQGDSLFSEVDVLALWRETRGLPAAINNAARAALLAPEPSDNAAVPSSFALPIWHMIIIGVLLLALIMALFYMRGAPQERDPVEDVVPPSVVIDTQPPVESEVFAPSSVETISQTPPQENSASVQEGILTPANSLPSVKDGSDEVIPDEVAPVVVEPQAPIVSLPAEASKITKPVVIATEEAAKKVESNTPLEVVGATLNADERQVVTWPSSSYTLQVTAAGQLKGVQAFVKRQPNAGDLRIVRVLRQQKSWYIVLAGVYSDSSAARVAIQSLPQSQVNAGPWPRKVSDIQQKIREFSRK